MVEYNPFDAEEPAVLLSAHCRKRPGNSQDTVLTSSCARAAQVLGEFPYPVWNGIATDHAVGWRSPCCPSAVS